jgi:hypothetical protein
MATAGNHVSCGNQLESFAPLAVAHYYFFGLKFQNI